MNKPLDLRLLIASLALNLLLAGVAVYVGLRYQEQSRQAAHSLQQAERHRQEMLGLRVDLQALLSAESSQLAQLEQQSRQLAEQAQQLALYRQVLAPDEGPGLLLAQEDIAAQGEPGLFSYRLVLLQPGSTGSRVTGQARLQVRAVQDGRALLLDDDALGVAPVTLDFRHFQVLSGQLRLPSEVRAQTLEVRLELEGNSRRTLSLNWPIPDNT
ncbi:DUF6776 family protein [Zobellella iuensis]|uniref:Uncharacterized protein n=1 Tax=Zobellella iuensis TaxID=2803811 RepID=A0ABS1QVU4_9GAMM|nr:DUF6776 family protein [Zobellella iuensis]MBL1378987.1 hypothetical protein [Zobellella iuensis]